MTTADTVQIAEDICAPTLVQRVAALLGRDPATIREGDPMPRGWHTALFTASTPQGELRADGVGGLGFALPPSDLPRLVMGGRRTRFEGDIPVGERVRRESRIGAVIDKQGRSGPMRLLTVVHCIRVGGDDSPVLTEEQDYLQLGEGSVPTAKSQTAGGAGPQATNAPSPPSPPEEPPGPRAAEIREVFFDEVMLFRYSAITFNAHRIHYDKDYARDQEGYPGLLVNGGLSTLLLLEMFKSLGHGAPTWFASRNVAPLYCSRRVRMCAAPTQDAYAMWIEDEDGRRYLSAEARTGNG